MKLTVLVDNNSIIDKYYIAEPALSFCIEDEDKKVLFDVGYSDVYLKNAEAMNIDLTKIDTLILSHGHNDHTGGLKYIDCLKQDIEVIAHPGLDGYKEHEGLTISSPVKLDDLPKNFKINKTKESVKISKHLTYLGEIGREKQNAKGLGNDLLLDDSALVYEGKNGIFIITACSHSGIINIIEQAKRITNNKHITGIIGGFHMLNNPELNKEVCDYLAKEDIEIVYPCHCTDLMAKIEISKVVKIKDIGVSFTMEVE